MEHAGQVVVAVLALAVSLEELVALAVVLSLFAMELLIVMIQNSTVHQPDSVSLALAKF